MQSSALAPYFLLPLLEGGVKVSDLRVVGLLGRQIRLFSSVLNHFLQHQGEEVLDWFSWFAMIELVICSSSYPGLNNLFLFSCVFFANRALQFPCS